MNSAHFYLTPLEKETAAAAELTRIVPGQAFEILEPGVLTGPEVRAPSTDPCAAFVRQSLFNTEQIPLASVAKGAEAAATRIMELLREHEAAWRLHVFPLSSQALFRRADLIAQALRDTLRRKQKRLVRLELSPGDFSNGEQEAIVQLALASQDRALLSLVHIPSEQREHLVSTFSRGEVVVPDDKFPPSRAYKKLLEAEMRMGRAINRGEFCVDLGASPGGWSAVALKRGALVTAVDRSPLRNDLMQQRGLRFQKGDAFAFEPEARVDWLICDVIAFPEKSVELLERWLSKGWCRRFCFTLKFKGEAELELLEYTKKLLASHCSRHFLKQLCNNKNEVTACGETRIKK